MAKTALGATGGGPGGIVHLVGRNPPSPRPWCDPPVAGQAGRLTKPSMLLVYHGLPAECFPFFCFFAICRAERRGRMHDRAAFAKKAVKLEKLNQIGPIKTLKNLRYAIYESKERSMQPTARGVGPWATAPTMKSSEIQACPTKSHDLKNKKIPADGQRACAVVRGGAEKMEGVFYECRF
jgi:hypothetical protein